MPGWADVANVKEFVEVRGQKIDVVKLDLQDIADLIARFPELRKMFETRSFDLNILLLKAEDAVDAMIVISTGAADDTAAQTKIADLALGEKAALLAKIVKVTMPGGVAPFVELASAFGLISQTEVAGLGASASDTSSEPPPPS